MAYALSAPSIPSPFAKADVASTIAYNFTFMEGGIGAITIAILAIVSIGLSIKLCT